RRSLGSRLDTIGCLPRPRLADLRADAAVAVVGIAVTSGVGADALGPESTSAIRPNSSRATAISATAIIAFLRFSAPSFTTCAPSCRFASLIATLLCHLVNHPKQLR